MVKDNDNIVIIGGENNIVETVKYLLTGIVDIEKPEFVLLKLFFILLL